MNVDDPTALDKRPKCASLVVTRQQVVAKPTPNLLSPL